MAVNSADNFLILFFLFTCLCFVTCQFNFDNAYGENPYSGRVFRPISVSTTLNLTEGSICWTEGHNGTCESVYKCTTASWTYKYRNAGFDSRNFPKFPDICSINEANEIIVCCTDCKDDGNNEYDTRKDVVLPDSTIGLKKGPRVRDICLDYLQNLPYQCDAGVINYKRGWNDNLQCSWRGIERSLAEGGRDAARWEFPHMALLGYGQDKQSALWFCGGSVISDRFILTAAHCSSTRAVGPITIAALGLLKRSDPPEHWKIYKIKRIIMHPEYKSPSKYHDIALLETEHEINFGRNLLPACLPYDNSPVKFAEAPGWGQLGHRKGVADNLQVVGIEEFDELECALTFPPHRLLTHGYNHSTQMCYGSQEAVVNTCRGDSGGPLLTNENNCLYTIIGVTSFGKGCGILGSPGIYTRVSHYVPWIESIVWP